MSKMDVRGLAGDPVVLEATERLQKCMEWESTSREYFVRDLKFANGDSENGFQWPDTIFRQRGRDQKPCLTLNLTKQHNLQISNEAKKNKSTVKVIGLGGGATQESAKVCQQLIRHTEYISNAQSCYGLAREFQVDGGIGYWRIVTQYASNDTFNQEAYIVPVIDPLSVYLDPDIIQRDGSDAKFGFIFDSIPVEEFDAQYPKYAGMGKVTTLGLGSMAKVWFGDDNVAVCEYYRKVEKKDLLISFIDSTGTRKEVKKSKLPEEVANEIIAAPLTKTRDIWDTQIEWKLIAGDEVIDETTWPGKYIPIVRVVGMETIIDGRLDRKGHTRAQKDAQRMFNYNASGQVEFVALQSKTPWLAPAKAIEEFETAWNQANTSNASVMPYNHIDDDGNPIPAPQRAEPPKSSPGFQDGMNNARQQIMEVSGQYQADLGMAGNERTGAALDKRQEQSATSVFHFQDNFADALRFSGKILLDLYPHIYDVKQVKTILADDGTDMDIQIDPNAKQAYQQEQNEDNVVISRVLNLSMGKYDIASDVGPALGSKRQETVQALTLILTQAPALTGIIGDILMDAMDFDKAQEAARRLKRMVPPQALGQGPTQAEQELHAQVQQLTSMLSKALQQGAGDKLKLTGKDQARDIDVFQAQTDRLKVLQDALPTDPEGLKALLHDLVGDALKTHLTPIIAENQEGVDDQSGMEPPPVPGAKKAPDGEWYVLDPTRKGKYLRLGPLAQERTPDAGR